jgi:hypothetical protein
MIMDCDSILSWNDPEAYIQLMYDWLYDVSVQVAVLDREAEAARMASHKTHMFDEFSLLHMQANIFRIHKGHVWQCLRDRGQKPSWSATQG